jgi:hypothetical protein
MHSYSPIKEALRRWIPEPLLELRRSWRNRQRARYTEQLVRTLEARVLAGPFAGMQYTENAVGIGSVIGPKLLGTYEAELYGVVERLVGGGHDWVINVGAGEGYYAVGLLRRMPAARGLAFETNAQALPLIRRLADQNEVGDRLETRGTCARHDLAAALEPAARPVVVMDAEGAEDVLLNPAHCLALRKAAVLVEVHEFLLPGVTDRLLNWYAGTHAIDRIPSAGADSVRLPVVAGFSRGALRLLADEMRSFRMDWLWMTPRTA